MTNVKKEQLKIYARRHLEAEIRQILIVAVSLISGSELPLERLPAFKDAHPDMLRPLQGGQKNDDEIREILDSLISERIDTVFTATHLHAKTESGDITPDQQFKLREQLDQLTETVIKLAKDHLFTSEMKKEFNALKGEIAGMVAVQTWQNVSDANWDMTHAQDHRLRNKPNRF